MAASTPVNPQLVPQPVVDGSASSPSAGVPLQPVAPQPPASPGYLSAPAPGGSASAPGVPPVPPQLLARQAAAREQQSAPQAVTPTVLPPAEPARPAAPSGPFGQANPPGVSAYQNAQPPSAYASAPAPVAPRAALEATPSVIPGFTPAPTVLALPALLSGGSSTNAAAPSAPAPSPVPDAPHPTTAPSATVPTVSQPSPASPAGGSGAGTDANAAYLASLGVNVPGGSRSSDAVPSSTGPQPIAMPSEPGPLGPAPATALAFPQEADRMRELAPENRTEFGAPAHRG